MVSFLTIDDSVVKVYPGRFCVGDDCREEAVAYTQVTLTRNRLWQVLATFTDASMITVGEFDHPSYAGLVAGAIMERRGAPGYS